MNNDSQKLDSFEIWLNERPKWLQSAACFLIEYKRMPNEAETAENQGVSQLDLV